MIQETDPENLSEDHDHIEDNDKDIEDNDEDIEDNENEEEEMGKELFLIAVCAEASLHLGMVIFYIWHSVMNLLGEYFDFSRE